MLLISEHATEAKNRFLLRRFKVIPNLCVCVCVCVCMCACACVHNLLLFVFKASGTSTCGGRTAAPSIECWSGSGAKPYCDAPSLEVCLLLLLFLCSLLISSSNHVVHYMVVLDKLFLSNAGSLTWTVLEMAISL